MRLAGSQFGGDGARGIFHCGDQALLVGKSHFRRGDTDRSYGLAIFAENRGADTAAAQRAFFEIAGVALGTHEVEFLVQGDLFDDGAGREPDQAKGSQQHVAPRI